MNEIKPFSERETELKEEMKSRCLNKGLYIDENAQEKFKMLCHLEDFEVKYHELEHNWNELKKYIEDEIIECKVVINTILPEFEKIMSRSSGKTLLTNEYNKQQIIIKSFKVMLSKMQELERIKR